MFSARVNTEFKEHTPAYQLLDVATGAAPAGMTAEVSGRLADGRCVYDQRSVVVCVGEKDMSGVDAESHSILWTISGTDATRNVPDLDTAWHGAVYGRAGTNYVVLDARTGQDRATFDGPGVYVVNEYAGLDLDFTARPALG